MGLVEKAGPGIEKQADQVAVGACELTDATAGTGWQHVTKSAAHAHKERPENLGVAPWTSPVRPPRAGSGPR